MSRCVAGRSLDELWPDADRRDAALTRLLIRVHTGTDTPPPKRERHDPGVVAFIAASAWNRINPLRPLRRGY